ncbi:MAG: aliphatic sulfonate ABC transporter substrate-binding protein [Bacillota bacterium]
MKKLIMLSALLISILTMVTVGGCSAKTTPADASGKIVVKIAHFPNITHSQALVGRVEGQFEEALGDKASIEWKVFNAGPDEIEAFLAGEVDLGYIGPGPAVNGYVKTNGELVIIAGAVDAGAIFVSRKDLVIKDLKELNGKKIAVPQYGNTQDLTLRKVLLEHGLKDTTKGGKVEIVQAKNPDIMILLDRGEVDAAFVPEPWGSRLINEVNANIILDYDQVLRNGKYTTAVVIARKEFLEQHPDIVEGFLKTHVEITESINQNLDQAKNVVNDEINALTRKALSKDVLDSSFSRLIITYDPEIASVNDFNNLSFELGFFKQKPAIENLFSLELLNKVLKDKGLQEIK